MTPALDHSSLSHEEFKVYSDSLLRLTGEQKNTAIKSNDWKNIRVSLQNVRGALRERFGDEVRFEDIEVVSSQSQVLRDRMNSNLSVISFLTFIPKITSSGLSSMGMSISAFFD